jgi:multidrug transporter EmrE-like cation transporter
VTSGTGLATARVLGLLLVTLMLGGGQLLFKLAAERLTLGQGNAALISSFISLPMLAALALYAVATVFWVYLLHGFALSRAYPFIALAFAIVPLMGWLALGEALGPRYWLGLGIMLAGLYVIASSY